MIEGNVGTMRNRPVANARIELRNLTSGATVLSTYTNSMGRFEFVNVPYGAYEVVAYAGILDAREEVHLSGFQSSVALRIPDAESPSAASAGNGTTVSVRQFTVPHKAREYFKKAQKAVQEMKLEDAHKYVAQALQAYPQYAEAMTLRGILKLDANDPKEASADLEQAIQFDPAYGLSYVVLGAAYNVLSRFDDALRAIDRGIALDPLSWQGYFEMGRAYAGKGDYGNAIRQLNKAEELAPKEYALIHLVKAHAMLGLKDYGNAMTELEAYLQRDPQGPNSQHARETLQKVRAFAATPK